MSDGQRRFEIWLSAWSSERIGTVAALLDYQEQEHMAEVRAVELIQLSREKGFRDNHGNPEGVRQRTGIREASHTGSGFCPIT
jgi:hypothetical protein